MKALNEIIKENWAADIIGNVQIIAPLRDLGYPAWTVRFHDSFGVAVQYNGIEEINEFFANARIYSCELPLENGVVERVLLLTTSLSENADVFAALCAELIDPGIDGEKRKAVCDCPVDWWKKWKEILGNRSIDARIYDVLGELCVFKQLLISGRDAQWNGPEKASYDIETESFFAEVKSTISRDKKEVTISSQFQLFPPQKPLKLIFCRFEPSVFTGISIDQTVDDLGDLGYNKVSVNRKLGELGFDEGMSARKKCFILHEMLKYDVEDGFPRITPESFVGGVIPEGIGQITYTVDLSGMTAESMVQGENDGVQNN